MVWLKDEMTAVK